MNKLLVIFDIDGTLTDSVKMHQDSYVVALNQMNLYRSEAFSEFKHHTDSFIFKDIYFQNHGIYPTGTEVTRFYKLLTNAFETACIGSNISEVSGATDFLGELEAHRIPFVFATGSIAGPAFLKLKNFNIPHAGQLLASADLLDSREEIVLHAVEMAKTFYKQQNFETKIIVGDGKWDFRTAKNLGMDFQGIGNDPGLMNEPGVDQLSIWPNFQGKTFHDLLPALV